VLLDVNGSPPGAGYRRGSVSSPDSCIDGGGRGESWSEVMSNSQSLHALLDQTSWIHALARRLVSDPHLAADLAQETCVDALEQEPDGLRPLRGWLATVMRNKLSKLRRGDRNRARREERAQRGELEPSAHDVVVKAETHRNVVLAVLALDEPYRSTLLMRFF